MNNLLTVFKKEVLDMWRDKKTLLFTIFLPVLLYPVMFMVMGNLAESMVEEIENGINISITGDTNSKLATMITSQPNIKLPEIEDEKQALKDGTISLIINIPKNFDSDIEANKKPIVQMFIDETSNTSQMASSMIQTIYNQYKNNLVENTVINAGLDTDILEPFTIESKSGITEDGDVDSSKSMMSGYIPMILIIFMLITTTGIAADLGSGEKEKLTLEPLLSTSCNRNALLWGKIAALCTISIVGLVANLSSLVFSFNNLKLMGESVMSISMDTKTIFAMFFVSLLLQVAISSLQIAISIFARSTKEANTYLGGVMVPAMVLCFIPLMMDVKNISLVVFNVPIANIVALMKEFMCGIYNPTHIGITAAWLIGYVVISVVFAKVMFSREEVVFRS